MNFRFTLLGLCGMLLLGCAKIRPPDGGPVDKEPPRILSHYPSADQLEVARDVEVEIVFSEAMDRERSEEALFISPAGSLELEWSGSKLRIATPLAAERTYVLTVGTGARDLRGNSLAQSFTLAFATGVQLDQGLVRGRVYRANESAARVHVWAYDLGNFGGRVGFAQPSYQTQSGADGTYEFTRLAPGRYRVLAFTDENRNALPDPDEWLALPAADVVVSDEASQAGDLVLDRQQIAVPELKRVQAVHAARILLLFADAVDPAQLDLVFEGLEVKAVYAVPDALQKVYVETALQESGQTYALRHLSIAGASVLWDEFVRGSARLDRVAPSFVARHPSGVRLAPDDQLELLFSEAMRPAVLDDFWIESDSTQAPLGRWHWPAPNRARFVADAPLTPGMHRLVGDPELLADRAGNSLAGELIKLDFEVGAATAAIRGKVLSEQQGSVQVMATRKGGRVYVGWTDRERRFALDGLLAGSYILSAFVDRDGDGKRGAGSLDPYRPSEPYGRYGEPVDLETGQVVAAVEIRCY